MRIDRPVPPSIQLVWATVERPPNAVLHMTAINFTCGDRAVPEIVCIPVVISVMPDRNGAAVCRGDGSCITMKRTAENAEDQAGKKSGAVKDRKNRDGQRGVPEAVEDHVGGQKHRA